MAMIAAISLIGIGAYNQAVDGLDTAGSTTDTFSVITSVAEPGLQLFPLVLFAILGMAVFAAIRGLPS
jgi:hypothetical protein